MRRTKARKGGREPVRISLNDPLPPTHGLMKCRKVKMSTCQLAGNILVFLARGNSAIREWQHSDLNACLRSLIYARMCSIAGSHGMFSSNAEFHPSRHCRFCKKKTVTCRGTKVPQVSLYRVVKNKQLVAFTDSESFNCVRCSCFAWPYKAREERTAIKRELPYLCKNLRIYGTFYKLVSKSNDGISVPLAWW